MAGNPLMQRLATVSKNLCKKLRSLFGASTGTLPSTVSPNESITSFVFRLDDVTKKTQKIHHSRLTPRRNPETRRLETSVCRSQHITETRVWAICAEHFDQYAPKPAIGRGIGLAKAVFNEGLYFDPDGIPYAEHANIIGWHDSPNIPDSEQKHFWVDKAQRMAPQFSFFPRPKSN